jgi:hypothetical protein
VLLEVDENEHVNYNISCEIARLSEIMDSVDFMNLHTIRFNPNETGVSTEEKRVRLIGALCDAINTNFGKFNDVGCVVQYIGYSNDRIVDLDTLTCKIQSKSSE